MYVIKQHINMLHTYVKKSASMQECLINENVAIHDGYI